MDSPIITRFAPSPTGNLHLGHALAAWEARSLANRFSGKCVLRMEDIDQTRCRPEFVQGILKDLEWLGIRFDGPMMVQSSRFSAYEHALQTLPDKETLMSELKKFILQVFIMNPATNIDMQALLTCE